MTDEQLRRMWLAAGGESRGPTATMTEALLFPFLRGLIDAGREDVVRLDWVEQNLLREGEIQNETGAAKVRTWNIVTARSDSLRETIDILRSKFSH